MLFLSSPALPVFLRKRAFRDGQPSGRWAAQIGFKWEKYCLGAFDRAENAAEIRKYAEEELHDKLMKWYYSEYLPGMKAEAPTDPHIPAQAQLARQQAQAGG